MKSVCVCGALELPFCASHSSFEGIIKFFNRIMKFFLVQVTGQLQFTLSCSFSLLDVR